jgi:rhomboid family GlyGly-CTERM serine protease
MAKRLHAPGLAWCALAAVLASGALLAQALAPTTLDWQTPRALAEPWRLWTAAFVHFSALHLGANLLGMALVALLGWRSGASARLTLAWFIAWPLTHAALAWQPELVHYGGLSGVLHAGVAAIAVSLIAQHRGRRRTLGLAVLAVMAIKLLNETPWEGAVQTREGWDIAIAPLAHVTGTLAGALCALVAEATAGAGPRR